ncbi:MAG: UDP-glucose/GDP-mannose dehydrogenase family protein, partial [Bacilli bacterium]
MNICIIGVGYVGLVVGTCFAEMGYQVKCVDSNKDKISDLRKGVVPIYEPELTPMVRKNIKEGRLHFTTDLFESIRSSLFIFIAVGTPSDVDGTADLSNVINVAIQIGDILNSYSIIINKSTVPIGSGEKVKYAIREQLVRRVLHDFDFDIVSNPEFLREGAAVEDFMNPNRIIIASDNPRAIKYMEHLYEPLIKKGHPMLVMDTSTAELTKYAANAMLATRISFINEMAGICEAVGADIENVSRGIGLDHRIGKYFLSAGIGYGGSCFPKDVRALINSASKMNVKTKLLRSVEEINNAQKTRLFDLITSKLGGDLTNRKLAVWGLAFKPDTDDIREAPSIDTINLLRTQGAIIHAHDPAAILKARKVLGAEKIHYFT